MTNPLVLITRPIEQAKELADQLSALGIEALIQPLLTINPVEADLDRIPEVDALVITSSQAIRFCDLPRAWLSLPVFAVGQVTLKKLREHGFLDCRGGAENIDALIPMIRDQMPHASRLVYLRGQDVTQDLGGALPEYTVTDLVTYRADKTQELSQEVRQKFLEIRYVLLFSERTARIFGELLEAHQLIYHVQNIILLSLSPSVIKSLEGWGWKACYCADQPTQESLIHKLNDLIQQDA